jgi:hypothetical protein
MLEVHSSSADPSLLHSVANTLFTTTYCCQYTVSYRLYIFKMFDQKNMTNVTKHLSITTTIDKEADNVIRPWAKIISLRGNDFHRFSRFSLA